MELLHIELQKSILKTFPMFMVSFFEQD